jgi:hypothetical protein
MKNLITIVCISGLILSGCNLFNTEEKPTRKIEPFEWSFDSAPHSSHLMYVDSRDRLYAGGNNYWAISSDKGKTFKTYQQPDSVRFELVKHFENTFYAIGEYEVDEVIFSSPSRVQSNGLFKSDDGNNWELILGPFWMYDLLLDDDRYLHVAKYGGISTIDLSTDTEFLNQFLNTNSADAIKVLAKNSKGDVFAGCHDGVYKTTDNGKNWLRVSYPDVPKNLDSVDALYIDEKDRIFAIAARRLLLSLDDGESWSIQELKYNRPNSPNKWDTFYPGEIAFSSAGLIYTYSYYGLYVAHLDSADTFYFAGPNGYDADNWFEYSNPKAFSDGSVILQNDNSIIYGRINAESDFWLDRGWTAPVKND